jgi:hypothetical protein
MITKTGQSFKKSIAIRHSTRPGKL